MDRRLSRFVAVLGLSSFLGLMLCKQLGPDFARTRTGSTLILILSCALLGTLFLFVPLCVFLDRKRVRAVRKQISEGSVNPNRMPLIRRFLFQANYGRLPRWLYLPFVIVATILGAFAILALLAFSVLYIFVKCFGLH
jgi:hypothetical protein